MISKDDAVLLAGQIFNDQKGKKFLQYLRQITIEQENVPDGETSFAAAVNMGKSEGRKSLVRLIENLLKEGDRL